MIMAGLVSSMDFGNQFLMYKQIQGNSWFVQTNIRQIEESLDVKFDN